MGKKITLEDIAKRLDAIENKIDDMDLEELDERIHDIEVKVGLVEEPKEAKTSGDPVAEINRF